MGKIYRWREMFFTFLRNMNLTFLNCFHETYPVLLGSIFLKAWTILSSSSSGLRGRLPQQHRPPPFARCCCRCRWARLDICCFLGSPLSLSPVFLSIFGKSLQSTKLVFTANSKKFSLLMKPFLSQSASADPSSNSTWRFSYFSSFNWDRSWHRELLSFTS